MNLSKKKKGKVLKTYAFIDASNIIYGTRDEGWKVDFKKLTSSLRDILSKKNEVDAFKESTSMFYECIITNIYRSVNSQLYFMNLTL